jgi:hypothetical protein
MLRESLRTLIGEEIESRIDIGLAKDGSGVGGKLTFLAPLCCRMTIRHLQRRSARFKHSNRCRTLHHETDDITTELSLNALKQK